MRLLDRRWPSANWEPREEGKESSEYRREWHGVGVGLRLLVVLIFSFGRAHWGLEPCGHHADLEKLKH